jgi:hypothetical protein
VHGDPIRYTPPARATSHSSEVSARNHRATHTKLSLITNPTRRHPKCTHLVANTLAEVSRTSSQPSQAKPHPHNRTWGPRAPKSSSPERRTQPKRRFQTQPTNKFAGGKFHLGHTTAASVTTQVPYSQSNRITPATTRSAQPSLRASNRGAEAFLCRRIYTWPHTGPKSANV